MEKEDGCPYPREMFERAEQIGQRLELIANFIKALDKAGLKIVEKER